MSAFWFFILFLFLLVFIEILLSKWYQRLFKKKQVTSRYSWSRYIFFLLFPLLAFLFAPNIRNWEYVKVFAIAAFLGTFGEWLLGFCYHTVVGQRLWTYHRFGIMGYTSLLVIPLWGIVGVLSAMLFRNV
jgi:hypothetical protein